MWHIALGVGAAATAISQWVSRHIKRSKLQAISAAPAAASNVARAADNPGAVDSSTFHGDPTTSEEAPNAPTVIGRTPSGNPLVAVAPNIPGTTIMSAPLKAATSSASGPAHALYDFMKATPMQGETLRMLVAGFQRACNAEPECMDLLDGYPLRMDGAFDLPTSAMLTVMTGDPIPPSASMTAEDKSGSLGPAAFTASNLYSFLKQYGNVNMCGVSHKNHSPMLLVLVRQFQQAVNSDPKYPGPVSADAKPLSGPLPVTGVYDPATAAALSHVTLDHVNP